MYDRRLRVFISSRMQELAPERHAIKTALEALKIDAWVFEESAGAQSQSIQQTFLDELADADLYLGVFWNGYGDYTIDEYTHACESNKQRLVYEKRVDLDQRDPQLAAFLSKICAVETGVTPSWFATAEELAGKVQTDVARWQASLSRRELKRAVDLERERQETLRAAEHATPRQRIVNLAPQSIAELFKDRTEPMAQALDLLVADDNRFRGVTLFGQGGIGKTALACRVMKELESDARVHGLVYLSTRTTGITFERIYRDSARVLGSDVEKKLMSSWKKQDAGALARIQTLLEAFGPKRIILLLDNVESVMDANGSLLDPDLQLFLNVFLTQNHGARLLVTSREPLNPSNEARKYQKPLPLEDGLPADFAIELLRDLDLDGELGLRNADGSLLRSAAEKTQGYPTALEAIFSILSEDKTLTLDRLLADPMLFDDSVIKNLVDAALSRLDVNGHQVMQALAVFGRPVRDVAVHYLLEPFVTGDVVQETLRRLTRGLYINVKRSSGELILHPFYREFSYNAIPSDAGAAFNRTALESRAAGYYAQLRAPRESWKSIRDLDPQLFEFEHWLRAGQYDRAAEVLSLVDLDFLIWQGYARRVRQMRASLDGKIQDRRLQLCHEDSLGQICMILGPHEEGVEHFNKMKAAATELGDLAAVGRSLRGLGEMSRLAGRHEAAIAYCHEALDLCRQRHIDSDELWRCFFYLGLSSCYGGHAHVAIECGEQMQRVASDLHDPAGDAAAHDLLALAHLMLERWDESIIHARQALDGYAQVDSHDVCYVGNVEAMALFGAGRRDESLQAFTRTLAQSREHDLPRAEGLALFNQARVYRALDRLGEALESARSGLAILSEGRFSAAPAAQSLTEALVAAASGDHPLELRHLLDCACGSLENPDLYPPSDLIHEVQASAASDAASLMAEAAALDAVVRSRLEPRPDAVPRGDGSAPV